MSANLVANVSVSGTLTGANITTSKVRILTNPETLTASGAMNPYRPSVLRPVFPATQYFGSSGLAGTTVSPGLRIIRSTTDSNGNIYITGHLRSSTTFAIYNITANPNTSYSGYSLPACPDENAYLIKFNSAGIYQFSTSTFSDSNKVPDVAVDSSGNIYWAGTNINATVNGTIYNLTANPNTVSSGYTVTGAGLFILKYNSSGTYVSSLKSYGGTLSLCSAVACDSLGNVYVAGRYEGAGTIIYKFAVSPVGTSSGYTLPSTASTNDPFLLKYDSSGNYVSAVTIPVGSYYGQTYAGSNPIVCDSFNNVYWTGGYVGTPTIYNMSASPNTSSSGFSLPTRSNGNTPGTAIIKYNSSGSYLYSTELGIALSAAGLWPVKTLVLDSSENLYIGSYYCGAATIYNMTQNPNTSSTGYSTPAGSGQASGGLIMKYSSTGTYIGQSRTPPSSPYESATGAIACDKLGNVYWSGTYVYGLSIYNITPSIDSTYSGYSLPGSSNSQRPFLVVFNSSGIYQRSAYFPASSFSPVTCSVDSTGAVYWFFGGVGTVSIYDLTQTPNASVTPYTLPGAPGNINKYIPLSSGTLAMTLPNLGASVTNIITKPIYVKSGFSTTITENSNVFTVPASANVAMATWTTDRWVVTYQ